MEYLDCPSLTGEAIAALIKNTIEKSYGMDMNPCRGQCYDGAGNMVGIHTRFQELFQPIISTLGKISQNYDGSYRADARSDANGLLHRIPTFDFVINLVVMRHVLAYIQPLTYELQKVKLDISAVYHAVDTNVRAMKNARNVVETKHKEWYNHAKFVCESRNIPVVRPRVCNINLYCENHQADSVEEYYRRALTIPMLDVYISEMKERFSDDYRVHGRAFYGIPSQLLKTSDWKTHIEAFAKIYKNDIPDILSLTVEMDNWESFWRGIMDKEGYVPDKIRDTLTHVVQKKNWFPNMYTIFVISGCVPSTSNSCERSISKLRLQKTFLRWTMEQDRLNGLGLLFTHRKIEIDYDELLDIFARDYPHRLRLLDILGEK